MISLSVFLFRVIALVALIFGFVVLFEHGPEDFVSGARIEAQKLMDFQAGGFAPPQSPAAAEASIPETSSGSDE